MEPREEFTADQSERDYWMHTIATVIRKKDATASCYKDWYKVKLALSP